MEKLLHRLMVKFKGYLKGFDIKQLSKYVDWFNIMTYDIHGTWDGHNKWSEQTVNPHTNLTGRYPRVFKGSVVLTTQV